MDASPARGAPRRRAPGPARWRTTRSWRPRSAGALSGRTRMSIVESSRGPAARSLAYQSSPSATWATASATVHAPAGPSPRSPPARRRREPVQRQLVGAACPGVRSAAGGGQLGVGPAGDLLERAVGGLQVGLGEVAVELVGDAGKLSAGGPVAGLTGRRGRQAGIGVVAGRAAGLVGWGEQAR